jgi:hypothetical protein
MLLGEAAAVTDGVVFGMDVKLTVLEVLGRYTESPLYAATTV